MGSACGGGNGGWIYGIARLCKHVYTMYMYIILGGSVMKEFVKL